MAVYHAGGGFLGGLGKALQVGAMFIPGLQPIAAGANMIGGIANGDPMAAIMGGLGMMKGADGKPLGESLFGGLLGQKQPQMRGGFKEAMRAAHGLNMEDAVPTPNWENSFEMRPRVTQSPSWGDELDNWSRATPPQFAKYGDYNKMTGGAPSQFDAFDMARLGVEQNDRFKRNNPWGYRY